MKEWFELIEELSPSIVKIETPDGHGTGFLFAYNENRAVTAIATAHHVVEHANKWLQPIRLYNAASQETVILREGQRVIWPNKDRRIDSAATLVPTGIVASLKFPEKPIRFIPTGNT